MTVYTYDAAQVRNALNGDLPSSPEINYSSVFGLMHIIEEHLHSSTFIYPEDSVGSVVTAGAGAWTYGSYVELIPASTIADPYDVHYLNISDVSASDTYVLEFSHGASDAVAFKKKLRLTNPFAANPNVACLCVYIPANDRLRVRVKSSSGSNNITLSVEGHQY